MKKNLLRRASLFMVFMFVFFIFAPSAVFSAPPAKVLTVIDSCIIDDGDPINSNGSIDIEVNTDSKLEIAATGEKPFKLEWSIIKGNVSIGPVKITDTQSIATIDITELAVGDTSFEVQVSDGKSTDQLTVNVTVNSPVSDVNVAPVINSYAVDGLADIVGEQETSISITMDPESRLEIVASDSDTELSALTWSIVEGDASIGAESSNDTESIATIILPEGETNPVFTVQVSDGELVDELVVNVSVNQTPVIEENDPPVIISYTIDGSAATIGEQDTSISITMDPDSSLEISASDSDTELSALTWSIVEGDASIGAESTNDTESIATIILPEGVPNPAFTVQVSDGESADELAVNVTVNQTPIVIDYVSLGDSIATGTIYDVGWMSKIITSYPSYFAAKLEENNQGATVNWDDFSEDGDQSGDLLAKLDSAIVSHEEGIDTEFYIALDNAEVITISIGGNNLMQATKDSDGSYDFSTINTTLADEGRDQFETDWPQIVSALKSINDSATIIVNTLYNPYNIDDPLYETVIEYYYNTEKNGINDVINAYDGYEIADVYSAFKAYTDLNESIQITYLYGDGWLENLTRNPHPRMLGQLIITELNYSAYDPSYVPVVETP